MIRTTSVCKMLLVLFMFITANSWGRVLSEIDEEGWMTRLMAPCQLSLRKRQPDLAQDRRTKICQCFSINHIQLANQEPKRRIAIAQLSWLVRLHNIPPQEVKSDPFAILEYDREFGINCIKDPSYRLIRPMP